ncbi:pentatricopeptide repeat-containing protein At2g27610-like [Quercus suber]|uniref:pentatricopeptide repeat-containing protein At2g27610-like n=1 Tax=Quercus suber TaxID=58331 RepID=UPI000D27ECAC|nr:pentatricopeptide repeat-containing protein [Quercus suber]
MSCVLKIYGCLFDQNVGRQVHCQCIRSGVVDDVSVGTAFVDMYMKTENVGDGRRVFDEMGERNVVSWTSLLSRYAWNMLNDCFEQGGVLAPFFITDEPGDDKLVVEDDLGVHFGLDVFYSSRIEDALIELDGFLWDFWKKMPI